MIVKSLFWNIRSVKSQQAFHRVQMLNKHHKFFLVALMEPYQHQRQIHKYRRRLGMPYANSNCNGKIWLFVQHNVDVEVLLDTKQSITVKLQFHDLNRDMVVTMVYAKCSDVERMQLWDKEKIGGLPVLPQEYEDFAFCLNSCELHEMPFKGSTFTWWNGRAANDCIFKRLDRIVHNDTFQNWFGHLEVEHLSRTGSDHAPLLVSCGDQVKFFIKPFRFLKFWVEHDTFLDFVKQQWETVLSDDVFLSFKLKMKKLKAALSAWSKTTFGDIFKQLVIREDIVKIKEQLFEENPSEENRMVMQRAQAELKLYLHYEEEFWRQKAGMDCFSEGNKNTRYFHSLVKGRRKRIQIKRVKDDTGHWLEDADSVAAEAVNFFHKQFTHEEVSEDSPILTNIPKLIIEEDNILLAEQPTMEEVQKVVFELNGDSSCGPDGFSGIFYQKCWEVIKADVFSVVKDFFEGQTLPKSITHTNLVLLPKKNVVEAFSDMRPISLSNFINKVISRVVHDKLDKLLTRVISPNQSGFVKGRNIIENMGFSSVFIDLIWRLLANNWHSVLLNGQAHGFFHSTRGVKQGDPLSPALFIIAAEVLSRALNSLFDQPGFVGYGMPKWTADLNHLSWKINDHAEDVSKLMSNGGWNISKIMQLVIKWMRPAAGFYKCNTDGAAKGNPGSISAAFCIRNEEGDLVYAAAKIMTDGTNIVAEAEAIRMGLMYCVEKQLFPLIIETDSMTMKKILNAEWKIPWSISMLVDDIMRMMNDQRVSVEHMKEMMQ
ncbi:uncharacterized protein LOC132637608 [Lycium barbarum]|uniref:uncharacterized protein LOC132637608 n=1 Tax=Lycium barbarum TaxID=112863 RepID=UPI00293E62CC|nr:uncharacterized protein LOC132637608 [Lycium barbarum]